MKRCDNGGLATASAGPRALMGCGDVRALPRPFSRGAPQFAPHASVVSHISLRMCQRATRAHLVTKGLREVLVVSLAGEPLKL